MKAKVPVRSARSSRTRPRRPATQPPSRPRLSKISSPLSASCSHWKPQARIVFFFIYLRRRPTQILRYKLKTIDNSTQLQAAFIVLLE